MDIDNDGDQLIVALNELAESPTATSTQLQLESGAVFAALKALNRAANLTVRSQKSQIANARLAMDQTHLKLQNLLYERRHLEREIEKCNQFAFVL